MICYILTGLVFLLILFGIPEPAYADNCGSLSDCYGVAIAAAIAGVAIPILISLLLDFSPFGRAKGILEAILGRDLITGGKLAWWERLLNLIPGIGKLGKLADEVGDLGKAVDKAEDAAKAADKVEDLGKAVNKAEDATKAMDEAQNTVKAVNEAEDARKSFKKLRNDYAERLGVAPGGQVHHAIELQVLEKYPGVFTKSELNAFTNMRGIATELENKRQLHNSKIREIWDRHYNRIDSEIASLGLQPGTQEYKDFVRQNLLDVRNEIDYVLGQFFTEYRTGRPRYFN